MGLSVTVNGDSVDDQKGTEKLVRAQARETFVSRAEANLLRFA